MALVAVMAQVGGFSGEPRYAVPGAALVVIGGAVGLVRVASGRPVVAVAAAALVLVTVVPRVAGLVDLRDYQAHKAALARDLPDAIASAGGRDAVLRCGTPYVGPYRGPLLAWHLNVAKREVEPDAPPRPPGVVFASRLNRDSGPAPPTAGFPPARATGLWTVTNC